MNVRKIRPTSIEQREGRGIRQGNENDEVAIYRYVTKETFDAYNWSLVENKQRFISQVMTSKAVTTISKEEEAILKEGGVIGIIEIPSIDIRYPVMEGTGSDILNAGIGHIPETAGIGEVGNCVLCGHNGSRYGTFFTPLSRIAIGDEVSIMDKNGQTHIYEVTGTDVVNPYDNSIKTQGMEKELTLFTCYEQGTMRFVVRCRYKEAADE